MAALYGGEVARASSGKGENGVYEQEKARGAWLGWCAGDEGGEEVGLLCVVGVCAVWIVDVC